MKIAQIAPIAERVPPEKYGGTERVVFNLTEGLVRRGHEVTLFATGDSVTQARLESVYPHGLRQAGLADPHGINPWTLLHIGNAYQQEKRFDIIHDHNFPISLPAANLAQTPVVLTVHSPMTKVSFRLFNTLKRPYLVSISKYQLQGTENLNFIGSVYNGLNFTDYPFGQKPKNYLLFVGRCSPEKGLHLAIEAARRLDMTLIIAAKIDQTDQDYFRNEIAPRLSRKIIWIGEVGEDERNKLYSEALAFLHPVTWPEPFGLTMIEAMATGTPVVAFRQGSVPEIVKEGVSGYIADSIEGMVESVRQIDKINRQVTRNYAIANFNSSLMVEKYERVYQQILSNQLQTKIQPANQFEFLLGSRLEHRQETGNGSGYPRFRKG